MEDLYAYQVGDPDEHDIDDPPFPEESNPYGLTVLWNGDALVADAAANDIVRVSPDGTASTLARFDVQMESTSHLPPEMGLPPQIPSEAVPTSVTTGPDGYVYVGTLQGFPFAPGSSEVWRIAPWATDAWCSTTTPDPTGGCTLFSAGYTAINDIAFDHATGKMYVYELAAGGVLAFEAGFESGAFPPAVLKVVKRPGTGNEHRRELAPGQLSQPGGVQVVWGKVYVTDNVFTGGRLLRIMNA